MSERKPKGYIYRIHNKETGRSYVGQTINIEVRWKQHRWELKAGEHHCDLKENGHHCSSLQEAWNSYGEDAFLFEKILECRREELTEKEQEAWDREENPYNGRPRNFIYPEPTPETRKKISLAISGEKNPLFGKLGKDHPNSKPVLQYDLEGHLIREFGGVKEAARETGANHNSISACCKGKRKSAGGFIWRYKVGEVREKNIETVPYYKKSVLQYDKEGNFIAEYESGVEAERETGVDRGHISGCCKGKRKSAGGFIWRYKVDENIKEQIEVIREPHSSSKPVLQYDKEGNLLAEYESGVEAERKTGVFSTSITACCKGKLKSTGGFIWRYKDQPL